MITLKEIIEALNLELLTPGLGLNRGVTAGYASDLLSCVMAGAKKDNIWVTLQSHMNVVAVASLLSLSAVLITEGKRPDPEVVAKAEQEGIVLLATERNNYYAVSRLSGLGIQDEP